jgi:hypothetical protein
MFHVKQYGAHIPPKPRANDAFDPNRLFLGVHFQAPNKVGEWLAH